MRHVPGRLILPMKLLALCNHEDRRAHCPQAATTTAAPARKTGRQAWRPAAGLPGLILAVAATGLLAAFALPARAGFLSRQDCRAIIRGDMYGCESRDCTAIVKGDRFKCVSEDCRAVILGDRFKCVSDDCRAIVKGDPFGCASGNCKAVIRGKPFDCR